MEGDALFCPQCGSTTLHGGFGAQPQSAKPCDRPVEHPPADVFAHLWKVVLPAHKNASGDDDDEEIPMAVLEVREVIRGYADVTVDDLGPEINRHRQLFSTWAWQAMAAVVKAHSPQLVEAAAASAVSQAYSNSIGVDSSDLDYAVLAVEVASEVLASFTTDGSEDT